MDESSSDAGNGEIGRHLPDLEYFGNLDDGEIEILLNRLEQSRMGQGMNGPGSNEQSPDGLTPPTSAANDAQISVPSNVSPSDAQPNMLGFGIQNRSTRLSRTRLGQQQTTNSSPSEFLPDNSHQAVTSPLEQTESVDDLLNFVDPVHAGTFLENVNPPAQYGKQQPFPPAGASMPLLSENNQSHDNQGSGLQGSYSKEQPLGSTSTNNGSTRLKEICRRCHDAGSLDCNRSQYQPCSRCADLRYRSSDCRPVRPWNNKYTPLSAGSPSPQGRRCVRCRKRNLRCSTQRPTCNWCFISSEPRCIYNGEASAISLDPRDPEAVCKFCYDENLICDQTYPRCCPCVAAGEQCYWLRRNPLRSGQVQDPRP